MCYDNNKRIDQENNDFIKKCNILKKKITIMNSEFIVFKCGSIKRKMKSGNWKLIKNNINHNKGYNVIMIDKKQFTRSQIIANAFLGYDLEKKDKNIMILHKDKNKLNCDYNNLEINNKNYFLNC